MVIIKIMLVKRLSCERGKFLSNRQKSENFCGRKICVFGIRGCDGMSLTSFGDERRHPAREEKDTHADIEG